MACHTREAFFSIPIFSAIQEDQKSSSLWMLVLLLLWTSDFPSLPRFPFPLEYPEPPEALFLPQSFE